MKTVSQMTVKEVIINERDQAGTDEYVKGTTNAELDRSIEVMTAYGYGLERMQDEMRLLSQNDFSKSRD